jgi:HK97 family phage major capsid protein
MPSTAEIYAALSPAQQWGVVWGWLTKASVVLRPETGFNLDTNVNAGEVHVPRVSAMAPAGFVAVGSDIPSETLSGDQVVATPALLAKWTPIPNQVVEDSSPSALNTAGNAMGKALSDGLEYHVFEGVGGSPTDPFPGFITLAPNPMTGSGDVLTDLDLALGRLRGIGGRGSVIFTDPATLTALTQLTVSDTSRQRLLTPIAAPGGPPMQSWQGVPILDTKAISEGSIYCVDGSTIHLFFRTGPEQTLFVDQYSLSRSYQTAIRATARVVMASSDPNGIVRIVPAAPGQSARKGTPKA